jgi:hypothetical protein
MQFRRQARCISALLSLSYSGVDPVDAHAKAECTVTRAISGLMDTDPVRGLGESY